MNTQEAIVQAVVALQNGDASQWAVIDNAYRNRIMGYCVSRTGDSTTAEELTQQVMIDAYQNIGKLADPTKFESWLFGIAYHKCMDFFRHKPDETGLPESLADAEDEMDGGPERSEPERQTEITQLQQVVRNMIDSLPEDQAAVIRLRYYEGLTVPEIAERLGENPNTIKSRLRYGEKKLRKSVREYEKKTGVKLGAIILQFPGAAKAGVVAGVGAGSWATPAVISVSVIVVAAGASVAGVSLFNQLKQPEPPETNSSLTEAVTEAVTQQQTTIAPTTAVQTTEPPVEWPDLYEETFRSKDMDHYTGFTTMYIDDDDIPEIYGFTEGGEQNTLWSVQNGKVIEKDLGTYYIAYIERSGKFRDPKQSTGVSIFSIYKLTPSGVQEIGTANIRATGGMQMYRWADRDYPTMEECDAAINSEFDRSKEVRATENMTQQDLSDYLAQHASHPEDKASSSEKSVDDYIEPYTAGDNKTLPRLRFDSISARAFQREMDELANEQDWIIETNYEAYLNNDILSVSVYTLSMNNGTVEHLVYNFDVNSLWRLTNEELLDSVGKNIETVEPVLKEKAMAVFDMEFTNYDQSRMGTPLERHREKTLGVLAISEDYTTKIPDVRLMLDDKGRLRAYFCISSAAGPEYTEKSVTL